MTSDNIIYFLIGTVFVSALSYMVGIYGKVVSTRYLDKIAAYKELQAAFANCLGTQGKYSHDDLLQGLYRYVVIEEYIKVYASSELMDLLKSFRVEANYEPDRPLNVENHSPHWKNKIDRAKYWNPENFNLLISRCHEDCRPHRAHKWHGSCPAKKVEKKP